MSLATIEQDCFPGTLMDELPSDDDERRWWALYTKSRQEKYVARRLQGFQIPFYLPLARKASMHRGRRVTVHLPLFSGYLFVYGTPDERVRCLTTNRISQVIPVHDAESLYGDLRRIYRIAKSDAESALEPQLVPGKRVRIRSGALSGLEGTVIAKHGQTRFMVSVDFLQQGASIEVEDFMFEGID